MVFFFIVMEFAYIFDLILLADGQIYSVFVRARARFFFFVFTVKVEMHEESEVTTVLTS